MQKQFISLGYRVDGHTFSVENAAGERLKNKTQNLPATSGINGASPTDTE